jgi:putative sterol carrier protein
VTHPFLSDQWFEAVAEIRDRHAGVAPPVPHQVRMNLVISEVPFGSGSERVYLDTSGGTLVLARGELDSPDVTVTTDHATAKAIIVDQDPSAAMAAFMSGKVKIQGDMTKLMAMQGAAASAEPQAREVAAEIKAVTSG